MAESCFRAPATLLRWPVLVSVLLSMGGRSAWVASGAFGGRSVFHLGLHPGGGCWPFEVLTLAGFCSMVFSRLTFTAVGALPGAIFKAIRAELLWIRFNGVATNATRRGLRGCFSKAG